MTRWEKLLSALDVNPDEFELVYQSKFDLSPEAWLKEQIEHLLDEDKIDLKDHV